MATMTTPSTDICADIRRANDNFEAAFANGDAAGLAALYTENGLLLPPGSEPVTGLPAIRNFWQAVMDMGIKTVTLETVDAEQHEDTAIERGNALLGGANGQVLDKGKYMVIWKQVNGQWELHQDIWNSNGPA